MIDSEVTLLVFSKRLDYPVPPPPTDSVDGTDNTPLTWTILNPVFEGIPISLDYLPVQLPFPLPQQAPHKSF